MFWLRVNNKKKGMIEMVVRTKNEKSYMLLHKEKGYVVETNNHYPSIMRIRGFLWKFEFSKLNAYETDCELDLMEVAKEVVRQHNMDLKDFECVVVETIINEHRMELI